MMLADIITIKIIEAGGPGSGCHGPNCGRPSTDQDPASSPIGEGWLSNSGDFYPVTNGHVNDAVDLGLNKRPKDERSGGVYPDSLKNGHVRVAVSGYPGNREINFEFLKLDEPTRKLLADAMFRVHKDSSILFDPRQGKPQQFDSPTEAHQFLTRPIHAKREVEGGGPGSGCHGPNCGRPKGLYNLKESVGINRQYLPQIEEDYFGHYVQWLGKQGATTKPEEVAPNKLKPIQMNINKSKALAMPQVNTPGKPIFVSKDSYILDGHHRWYKALATNQNIRVLRVGVPMSKLLPMTARYPYVSYKTSKSLPSKVKMAAMA